jgi:hypothetical protein
MILCPRGGVGATRRFGAFVRFSSCGKYQEEKDEGRCHDQVAYGNKSICHILDKQENPFRHRPFHTRLRRRKSVKLKKISPQLLYLKLIINVSTETKKARTKQGASSRLLI